MKESKFNVFKYRENGMLIYNTYSGNVLYLNKTYSEKYQKAKAKKFKDENFSDLIENLKKGRMIIPDTVNENELILATNKIARFSNTIQRYTIAPTMKCNFRCPYCYEKGVDYKTMDRKTIDAVKKLFKKDKEISKKLFITWYGGEPLLNFDIIEELSIEAIALFGKNYTASMVTNGYLLTPEIADKLCDLKIMNLQITIDGPPDIHNTRRKLPNGNDTFFVILENIKNLLNITQEITITIRINTDKTNIDRVDEVIQYLEHYNIKDKVGFYLAPVDNINGTCNAAECFNTYEFAREQINFIQRNIDKTLQLAHLPQRNISMCGAVANNSYVIDAQGDLYKCWNEIGNRENSIGSVFDTSIDLNKNLTRWLVYDIINDTECMNCKFLPLCMGGCPDFKIQGNEKKCSPIKENAEEMIELLYKYFNKKS